MADQYRLQKHDNINYKVIVEKGKPPQIKFENDAHSFVKGKLRMWYYFTDKTMPFNFHQDRVEKDMSLNVNVFGAKFTAAQLGEMDDENEDKYYTNLPDEQKTHVKNVTKFFETFKLETWVPPSGRGGRGAGNKDAISIMETSVKGIVRYMSFGKIQQIMDCMVQQDYDELLKLLGVASSDSDKAERGAKLNINPENADNRMTSIIMTKTKQKLEVQNSLKVSTSNLASDILCKTYLTAHQQSMASNQYNLHRSCSVPWCLQ